MFFQSCITKKTIKYLNQVIFSIDTVHILILIRQYHSKSPNRCRGIVIRSDKVNSTKPSFYTIAPAFFRSSGAGETPHAGLSSFNFPFALTLHAPRPPGFDIDCSRHSLQLFQYLAGSFRLILNIHKVKNLWEIFSFRKILSGSLVNLWFQRYDSRCIFNLAIKN